MNKVIYFFRSRGAGFSIEGLFGALAAAIRAESVFDVAEVCVPQRLPDFRGLQQNMQFARQQQASVYHITGDVHYLALALPPRQTVLTIHDCVSLEKHLEKKNYVRFAGLWLLFYYLPMRRVRYLTTISEKSRRELAGFVGQKLAKKIRVIPNHYNPVFVARPAPFNHEHPVILHIGTADHKNLPRLLKALTGIRCTLVIVGPISVRQTAQLLESGVQYVQKEGLTQAAMVAEYEACDLVSFVSLYEGFGMPIIEANVVGRPVLTSAIDPLRDVAGNAAHLVDPYSVESIRAGLLTLINDKPYRETLIEAGFQNARRYTLQQATDSYAALYHELISGQSLPLTQLVTNAK